MKSLELKYHQEVAYAYDLLRVVFFNPWREDTVQEVVERADLLADQFKESSFVKSLKKLKGKSLDEARWDYNRLFIGPKKPLASTFESIHRSEKKLMMRESTFQVREFYAQVGLEVEKLNQFPDDFIGFEFQYLFYTALMVVELLENGEEDKAKELMEIREEFLNNHPKKWFPQFCDDILKGSTEQIWKDLAAFILNILEKEESFIKTLHNN